MATAPSPLRVLIAEDNPTIRMATSSLLLAHWRVRLKATQDGREAFVAAIDEEWDLILMDLDMPVLDGYEATHDIRVFEARHTSRPPVPIVAYTSHAPADVRERCVASGMNDVLEKPANYAELARTIAKWTGRQPMQPQPEHARSGATERKARTD